nr:hypothetical protein [Tanacetum cinerariifolium]
MNYHPVIAENQSNPNAGFQDIKKVGEEGTQTYVLFPVLSDGSINPQNNNKDAFVDGKEHDDDIQKSVSPDIYSSSSGAQTRKQGDKIENKDKGKSLVVTITGFRDLNAEFKECNNNSSNRVNAASSLVSKADINNLESIILVSLIPTTRIHKDHPTSQIIGDLSSTTQTRSMVRIVRDQGFEDPENPDKVYKVVKALYGLHQAPRAWYESLANYLLENGFKRGTIDQTLFIKKQQKDILLVQIYVDDIIFGLQVKQKKDRIFINQDKYVAEILKKLGLSKGKLASTLIDTEKPWLKDSDVKRIFRYLKGKPYLGLWYPKDSPFDLVAYSDSDYAGARLDIKSTTGGCQFLGCRLISWQCKKQTVVVTSSTEAEYVAAASSCAQVLWIQNQLLDYGYHFMHTVIYIDNSSTICIIKNPILHSKTKYIEIRHHFIRDCNEKKLIQVVKIPTENNFVDPLTKAFDVGRFKYLVASIGLLNS